MTTLTRQQEIDIIAGVLSKHPDPGAQPADAAEHVVDALSMSQPRYQEPKRIEIGPVRGKSAWALFREWLR